MEPLPSFLRARLCAATVISLFSTVLRCCFRALLHPLRSAARPFRLPGHSVDVDSLHILRRHLYIAGEVGQWFSSPMPAHSRGCLLECDHPPCGDMEDSIELIVVNDRRCFCVLSQDIRLLQTDGQTEVLTGL